MSFATLLQGHIDRLGRSRKSVALAAAVDPSYACRIVHGVRGTPRREVVASFAVALDLRGNDLAEFFAVAGYVPPAPVRGHGVMDPTVFAVRTVLEDGSLSEGERAAFRGVVEAIAARWGR